MIRQVLRAITPPFLVDLFKRAVHPYGWHGDYRTWEDAVNDSTGYDSNAIAEKVLESALKVKNGEAAYERDSVLFEKTQYSWPVLAGLLWSAQRNQGKLNIVDIGGGYGSSYFQNIRFLDSITSLSWNVVEQKKFAALGKKHFESSRLRFYDDLEVCLREHHPPVALLSCVLPYLPHPYQFLSKLMAHRIPTVIVDRMPFMPAGSKHRITVHRVDPSIYDARIPTHIFSEEEFLMAWRNTYELVEDFPSDLGFALSDGTEVPNKGFIFQLKS